jgi:DNA repair protein RadA/Sms
MAKAKQVYACNDCGAQSPKWAGQCSDCGAWNSLVEETYVASKGDHASRQIGYAGVKSRSASPVILNEVELTAQNRYPSGMSELDRVLGGGLVPGSVILIGGDPGIGKSTLLLQTLCQLAEDNPSLYVTGEESLQQVAVRSKRLDLPQENLSLLSETQIERIITVAQKSQPRFMVIDSIQTIYTEIVQSAPGSVSQVRESTTQLVRYAKQTGTIIFLVGHVTKEGAIAGPRVLEHMVDTVLYFEGERDGRFRMIRAVKNRFGAVNELGVFAMTDKGLREVSNPSAIFLSRYQDPIAGSVVMATWEGSRPMLVEVQALVDDSHLGNPRRVSVGLEGNRLAMLLAVLNRHGGVATHNHDVFANVVGGVRVLETAADLALVLAILSSLRDKPLPADMVVFGEIGLSGEIRPVQSGQERLREAAKHGFKSAIVPRANAPKNGIPGMEIQAIDYLHQAL